jgi:uncharacterized membrane protein required for colicin V production
MELSELQNFDYIIMILIAVSIYFGWKTGFIESFISFFAWAGSAIIVADNYLYVYTIVNGYISSKFISGLIASLVFYIALVIVIIYLGTKISKITASFGGGTIDKIAGFIFGALRGAIAAIAIFWVCYITSITLNNKEIPKWLGKAKSYKALKLGADSIADVVTSPEEREKMLRSITQKTKDSEKEVRKKVITSTHDLRDELIDDD